MDDGAWMDGLGQDPYADILERAKRSEEKEREAEARRNAPLPSLWWDEIKPVLETRDFVEGLLIEASAAVTYGDSNTGKTFFVTDLALHVAAGLDWNGRQVDQGGVVYVAMEGGQAFQNRVYAWMRKHGLEETPVPFKAVPATLNLLDPDADTPRLIADIKAAAERMGQPVKLVVVDTLSRAMAGGNENASEDMGALVRNMDLIRAETGACILFVHHSGKDAAKGARGHSLLRAAVDTEIEVKADEDTGARTATVVKQREMAKGDSFSFRLDWVVLGQNQRGKDVTTCTVSSSAEVLRTKPKERMTTKQVAWHRDLVDMFAQPDGPAWTVPVPGMSEILTLTRKQVRDGLQRRGRFGEKPDGKSDANLTGRHREAMSYMLNALKDLGKIGMTDVHVWLIRPRQDASGFPNV